MIHIKTVNKNKTVLCSVLSVLVTMTDSSRYLLFKLIHKGRKILNGMFIFKGRNMINGIGINRQRRK